MDHAIVWMKKYSRTSPNQSLKEFELTDKVSDRTVRRGVIDEWLKGEWSDKAPFIVAANRKQKGCFWNWSTINGHLFIGRK